LDCDPFL